MCVDVVAVGAPAACLASLVPLAILCTDRHYTIINGQIMIIKVMNGSFVCWPSACARARTASLLEGVRRQYWTMIVDLRRVCARAHALNAGE